MEILSGANQPKDIVSKEYVDGQINNHVHDATDIPCESKTLKLGSKEYKISENLQNALENLLDYVYMNASGVLDLQTNLKSVSDTVSKIPAYKGGTGISIAGDTIGHSNNILPGMVGTGEILTPDFVDTVYTTWFSYDAQGHVTQSGTGGFVMPTVRADDSLSDTSTNPLQNKTVKAKFDAVDSQISSLSTDNGNLWARVKTKADNTAEGATALLGNLSESNIALGDEDEVIIKNLNQYTHRPLTKLFDWIKASLAKVATSGSYNDLANKPDIPTVDSSFSEDGTNAVAGNTILAALNSKANKTELQALSNQVSNKADKSEIPTVDDRSKIYPETSMTALGFTAKSTIPVYEFLSKLYEKGYTANSIVPIKWADAIAAIVSDGTNSVNINGGTLYVGKTGNLSSTWKEATVFFVSNASTGSKITVITATTTDKNTGASSAQHVTNFTSNAAYVKKTDVSAQPVLYTSTTTTSSATITNLFANYSLVWFQAVGSKTTHTHILPLAYLKSKGSLTFKDSGTPINILYVSDTQIRWFEYQGQGTETYTSVTIVRII